MSHSCLVSSWSAHPSLLSAALCVSGGHDITTPTVKRLYIHPPNACRILLPDGRHLAYQEQGVPAHRARFSMISAHPFLSSRLAGRIISLQNP